MNKIKSTHYMLVTDVIYIDGENAQRYNDLFMWWNFNHCNVTLKLRTVMNGKPMSILTLVTPEDRTDLVNEFNELVNKVNGVYPVYGLITVCGGLTIRDFEEEKAHHVQD